MIEYYNADVPVVFNSAKLYQEVVSVQQKEGFSELYGGRSPGEYLTFGNPGGGDLDGTNDLAYNVLTFGQGFAFGRSANAAGAGYGLGFAKMGSNRSTIQINRISGNLFRDELAAALKEEGRIVRTEVYKWTPFGKRYIDIDVRYNGVSLGGIETKVGDSRYLSLQKLKDAWLGANGYPVQLVRKPAKW